MVLLDSFEDGDTAEWTTDGSGNFFATTTPSFSGTWSGRSDAAPNTYDSYRLDINAGGAQLDTFQFYWQETADQGGFGLSFFNSNGDREFSVGSNNPQWHIDDPDGNENFYSGDGYDRWIRFKVDFDWSSSSYTLSGEDMSTGSTASTGSRSMYHGVDVQYIGFGNAIAWSAAPTHTWIDELTATGVASPPTMDTLAVTNIRDT
jgi:hypothetical protein